LTDLNYAKDGHVLLQLGDRHAWPEVYVEGQGWMVFDITPARAEGEELLIPDEDLLDQLMSKLNPVEELLDPVPVELEEENVYGFIEKVLAARFFREVIFALLILYLSAKLWLRIGYRFTNDPNAKILRAYASFASLMYDRGIPRYLGETRLEYCLRLLNEMGIDSRNITNLMELAAYGARVEPAEIEQINSHVNSVIDSHDKSHSKIKRFFAFFNPVSLTKINAW
jgi:hypothetical protein